MDAQPLSSKVAALEAKVAVLEDEGKIIKGEVKQILTEIRTAILSRVDNPFDEVAGGGHAQAATVQVVSAAAPDLARVQIIAPEPPPVGEREPEPAPEPAPERVPARPSRPAEDERSIDAKEPIMLRPASAAAPMPEPLAPASSPQWSLLTIASLTAWAEEAMGRLGALRFEILLDLCEAAGHVSPEARAALSRVRELDVTAPEHAPSTNETIVVLRQLDALLNDDAGDQPGLHALRR
ncbi:MAG: hypothetical protein IVW36_10010 [Dehalococcoidia bacterium]|nr:hypothetical protein [Dehalococcoidia bacterium]